MKKYYTNSLHQERAVCERLLDRKTVAIEVALYSEAVEEIGELNQEITRLKALCSVSSTRGESENRLRSKLSRLTAALNDDERAKKILEKYINRGSIVEGFRRDAINDYRADIKKEEMK